ncbi:MAG: hypothetical protein RR620_04115 [Clostridium sp.]
MVEACYIIKKEDKELLREIKSKEIDKELDKIFSDLIGLSIKDQESYRRFAMDMSRSITSIYEGVILVEDIDKVISNLRVVIKNNSFLEYIHSNDAIINCFINGRYTCNDDENFEVNCVRDFYSVLTASDSRQQRIILDNLNKVIITAKAI